VRDTLAALQHTEQHRRHAWAATAAGSSAASAEAAAALAAAAPTAAAPAAAVASTAAAAAREVHTRRSCGSTWMGWRTRTCPGEHNADGSINGSINGSVDGSVNGSVHGSINGSINGSVNGSINGSAGPERPLPTRVAPPPPAPARPGGREGASTNGSIDGSANGSIANSRFHLGREIGRGAFSVVRQVGRANGSITGSINGCRWRHSFSKHPQRTPPFFFQKCFNVLLSIKACRPRYQRLCCVN
jgi:hypothetical protein